ncbi:hypothetical protein [Streptomyces prunicolor]|uniref:hypothetical protein n=1 Tax=Streptomyces prunicolor TaxID=67348 RepID=UPI003F4CED56
MRSMTPGPDTVDTALLTRVSGPSADSSRGTGLAEVDHLGTGVVGHLSFGPVEQFVLVVGVLH